jgi:hypothetical protein
MEIYMRISDLLMEVYYDQFKFIEIDDHASIKIEYEKSRESPKSQAYLALPGNSKYALKDGIRSIIIQGLTVKISYQNNIYFVVFRDLNIQPPQPFYELDGRQIIELYKTQMLTAVSRRHIDVFGEYGYRQEYMDNVPQEFIRNMLRFVRDDKEFMYAFIQKLRKENYKQNQNNK